VKDTCTLMSSDCIESGADETFIRWSAEVRYVRGDWGQADGDGRC